MTAASRRGDEAGRSEQDAPINGGKISKLCQGVWSRQERCHGSARIDLSFGKNRPMPVRLTWAILPRLTQFTTRREAHVGYPGSVSWAGTSRVFRLRQLRSERTIGLVWAIEQHCTSRTDAWLLNEASRFRSERINQEYSDQTPPTFEARSSLPIIARTHSKRS